MSCTYMFIIVMNGTTIHVGGSEGESSGCKINVTEREYSNRNDPMSRYGGSGFGAKRADESKFSHGNHQPTVTPVYSTSVRLLVSSNGAEQHAHNGTCTEQPHFKTSHSAHTEIPAAPHTRKSSDFNILKASNVVMSVPDETGGQLQER